MGGKLLQEGDREFLRWIHARLVNVHKENPNYDYMLRLSRIIDAQDDDRIARALEMVGYFILGCIFNYVLMVNFYF